MVGAKQKLIIMNIKKSLRKVSVEEFQVCTLPNLDYSRFRMNKNSILFPNSHILFEALDIASISDDKLRYFYLRMEIGFRYAQIAN